MIVTEVLSDRPIPPALCKALAYQNKNLVDAAIRELQMSEEAVLELFFELRLYFYLCFYYAERLPAPAHIDKIWHIFLEHEEEYAAFCLECFNGTIEHILHTKPEEADISKTIDRAHEKFGPRLAIKWQRSTSCDGRFRSAA